MVIIILDNRKAELTRQLEKAQPPFRAKRHGRRKLMMRRNEHGTDGVTATSQFDRVNVDPVLVEPDRQDIGAKRAKGGDGGLVCQFFDDHRIARADQGVRGEENAVLAAAGDADILCRHGKAALALEHCRDTFAQRWRTAWIAILESIVARGAVSCDAIGARQQFRRKQSSVGRPLVELESWTGRQGERPVGR